MCPAECERDAALVGERGLADQDPLDLVRRGNEQVLVARLEERAKRDPAGYRTRVLLFALLGNAYLFAMVMFLGLLFLHAVEVRLVVSGLPFEDA